MQLHTKIVAAVATAAVFAFADPAFGSATAAPKIVRTALWGVVPVPRSVSTPATLNDVAASGSRNAWAVGAEQETSVNVGVPLILHWNGRRWSKVKVEGVAGPGSLVSVSAPTSRDVWVLGTDAAGTVLMHWDGMRWRNVRFPGEGTVQANSVAAARNGQAWLVGSQPATGGGQFRALVERWNGRAWDKVQVAFGGPNFRLDRVRVSPSGDVWAVGVGDFVGPLVAHFNKKVWTAMSVPTLTGVNDVLGISPGDVWVVGEEFNATAGIDLALIAHWNGHAWTVLRKPAPAEALGPNNSISPNAAGRPQWVGGTAGLNPTATVYAHFNGTKWATVQGATRLSGVFADFVVTAHVPGTNATWAVGGSAKDTAAGVSPDKVIIEFNPGVHGE